jgi:hypothetical protein
MPQYVPPFEWTDEALELRGFLFDFWCDNGRAPNLRQMHEGTGFDRRTLVQTLKLLQLGIVIVADDESPNCDILKAPPFSAFPSQVEMYLDGRFHSFIGCAHEAVAVSNTPKFRGREVRLETYDAHTLEPITLLAEDFVIVDARPVEPLVLVTQPPWDWVVRDMKSMCDHTNFVLSRETGERFERALGRRGIYFTVEQVKEYVAFVAEQRIYDYHWPPLTMSPETIVDRLRQVGVDVSPWGL